MESNGESQTGHDDPESGTGPTQQARKRLPLCDRCGFEMLERNCKVICPNCGSRYDCSDLTIYFD